MKKHLFLPWLLLFSMFFNAHASLNNYPDWVLNTPSDNRVWFYSVGAGSNQQQAQQAALAELSTRLKVSVQSISQQFVDAKNKQVDFFLEQDSKQVSEQFDFNNVEILSEHQDEQSLFVLVKVNKDSFFNNRLQQLSDNVSRVSPNSLDSPSVKMHKLINFNWHKNTINSELKFLNAFQIDTESIAQQLSQIERHNQDFASSVKTELVSTDLANELLADIKNWQNKALLNGLNKNSEHSLTIVVEGVNQRHGQDQFNALTQLEANLNFLYEGEIIYTQYLQSQAFSSNQAQATRQAWQLLKGQFVTN